MAGFGLVGVALNTKLTFKLMQILTIVAHSCHIQILILFTPILGHAALYQLRRHRLRHLLILIQIIITKPLLANMQ